MLKTFFLLLNILTSLGIGKYDEQHPIRKRRDADFTVKSDGSFSFTEVFSTEQELRAAFENLRSSEQLKQLLEQCNGATPTDTAITTVLTTKETETSAVSSTAATSDTVSTVKQTTAPSTTPCEQNTKSSLTETVTCEYNVFSISCPFGRVINIIDANYGRTSKTVCFKGYETAISNTNCLFDGSQKIVDDKCNGEEACEFTADIGIFKLDPCENIYKYLQVQYKCIPKAA